MKNADRGSPRVGLEFLVILASFPLLLCVGVLIAWIFSEGVRESLVYTMRLSFIVQAVIIYRLLVGMGGKDDFWLGHSWRTWPPSWTSDFGYYQLVHLVLAILVAVGFRRLLADDTTDCRPKVILLFVGLS